jgi:ABC-type antimicrobial peptide transport system permease subunit
MWRACLGIALGVGSSLVLGQWMESLLYGIRSNDPATLLAVSLFLMLVALLSALIPSLRAGRIPPAQALRSE